MEMLIERDRDKLIKLLRTCRVSCLQFLLTEKFVVAKIFFSSQNLADLPHTTLL